MSADPTAADVTWPGAAHRGPVIRVPASTANLGAGLDVLGLALAIPAEVGFADRSHHGEPADTLPAGARVVDEHHPAAIAFAAAGGRGPIWLRSSIPMARGLGYSGAVRVAGALAAFVQRGDVGPGRPSSEHRRELLALVGPLEGHADNVAASIHGGLVAVANDRAAAVEPGPRVVEIPMAETPTVVVWVPDGVSTSTDRSRAALPTTVPVADAVHNIGCVATLVVAVATGRLDLLDAATDDRLHQPHRLDPAGDGAAALAAGRAAGALAGWLSGSGPSIAFACRSDRIDAVVAAVPASGHAKVLTVDTVGAHVVWSD